MKTIIIPFNLKTAKLVELNIISGSLITRDGRDVKISCLNPLEYPRPVICEIKGVIEETLTLMNSYYTVTVNGKRDFFGIESDPLDLFIKLNVMDGEKKDCRLPHIC